MPHSDIEVEEGNLHHRSTKTTNRNTHPSNDHSMRPRLSSALQST